MKKYNGRENIVTCISSDKEAPASLERNLRWFTHGWVWELAWPRTAVRGENAPRRLEWLPREI